MHTAGILSSVWLYHVWLYHVWLYLQCEAIPESLKNMLLVMHTAGILSSEGEPESQLWRMTWERIDIFLPNLRDDVFKPRRETGAFVVRLGGDDRSSWWLCIVL